MSADAVRYARHVALEQVGEAGQARIRNARVLVIGLGGLGTAAAGYLAAAGVRRLTLNDYDRIDPSNLPRQLLYREEDIGQPKAAVATQRLAAANPQVQCVALEGRLDKPNLGNAIKDCDLVLDATDNLTSRLRINECAWQARKALVSGAAIRLEGQVAVFRLDRGTGPCYRCLYSPEEEDLADCAGQGVLAPVAGAIGSMMAAEALKILAGITAGLEARLFAWDALSGEAHAIAYEADPACPVCG